jgi:hypothetical protein
MANNKKVVGKNFDPYLVGLQFTSEGGTPLFTVGNFQITTNLTAPPKRNFQLGSFSDPLTLENLGSNLIEAYQLVNDNYEIFLNLDTENLLNFVLFGSFQEFVNVTINQIHLNWPASIYVYPIFGSTPGNTFFNNIYDPLLNTSTFSVNTNFFYNYYGLNYLQSGVLLTGTSMPATIRNLSVYYSEYVIDINGSTYRVLNFTGSLTLLGGVCKIQVQGDPFGAAANGNTPYHIRPNDTYLNRFFSSLDDFSRFLLDRNSVPQYTCTIYYEEITEDFFKLQRSERLTWPVSDGYNLDKSTGDFLMYKKKLLSIAKNYDDYKTDLMRRVLVTESISYSELNPRVQAYYPLNTTDKIEKMLHIYGREFDEIKKYIDGISFATNVSYNRQGNTPDALIKDFAYYLGWDILSPMDENQLLMNFMPSQSKFSGMTVGYTPAEAEIEFWRRLVLNSAFLWKSKGTRKGIEFLFDFINTPPALVNFNEYIYQAKNKLDVNKLKQILQYLYGNSDISFYNVDEEGYPKVPIDTLQMYFQKGGQWYRETAGPNSAVDYYEGNNPHIGPYDGGQEYINSFRCLLSSFSGQTIKITEEYVEFTNLFANYYQGNVDGYSGDVYVDPVDQNNNPTNCIIISGSVITNPSTEPQYSICGCIIPSAITQAIVINVKPNNVVNTGCTLTSTTQNCPPYLELIEPTNGQYLTWLNTITNEIISNVDQTCCESYRDSYPSVYFDSRGACRLTQVFDPCSGFEFAGSNGLYLYWTINGSNITTTNVPQDCCESEGGTYQPIGDKGACLAAVPFTGSGINTGTTSGNTCATWCVTNNTTTPITISYDNCNGIRQNNSIIISAGNSITLPNISTTPNISAVTNSFVSVTNFTVTSGSCPISKQVLITLCVSSCVGNILCGCDQPFTPPSPLYIAINESLPTAKIYMDPQLTIPASTVYDFFAWPSAAGTIFTIGDTRSFVLSYGSTYNRPICRTGQTNTAC